MMDWLWRKFLIATLEKIANVLGVDVTDLIEIENKPDVSGFVKVNGEVLEITSVADLEQALAKAKELK
ncbi:MAG: hypothetical protein IJW42_07475 [Alistipes sp.]|nr:hypothetical protein [Alistipes sp.]